LFFSPDLFVPMVNEEQAQGLIIGGTDLLNARGTRWVFMVSGHLKAGVTPAQAIADLNSIGSYLEKTYPKDDGQMSFTLARPGLYIAGFACSSSWSNVGSPYVPTTFRG
jgi:hypothetical protein